MNILLTLKLALGNLRARKGRTFLTMLGIVIGVAGVILIIALGAGAQSLVLGQVTKLGSNLIAVLPGKSDETGPPAAVFGVQITTLTYEDAVAMRDTSRLPHIMAVAPIVRGSGTITWGKESVDTYYTGTEAEYVEVQNNSLSQGRFFSEAEGRSGANVVVLGATVAELLFSEREPLGEVVKIGSVPFEVIGVQEKLGSAAFENLDDQVFIPLPIAQKQLLGISHLQFIRAKIDVTENVKPTIADVTQLLKERHRIRGDEDIDFSVRDIADAIKLLESITNALRFFLVIMAGISLVVGGVGIMNIMLVTVAERTREIGLRKAVGARNKDIRRLFLLEAGLLTFIGGLIGIVLGTFVAYGVALIARAVGYDWAFIISPIAVIAAVGVSILTGVVFGLYPAFKAAKLDPMDALRYE